ncbi:MAG: hypothetical protein K2X11_04140 [Acetobacteraceae bacterium]|nr:hypothetical protein [Acetobacteraceae bacterium]
MPSPDIAPGRRALLAVLLLGGCTDIPRPTRGMPGRQGAILRVPLAIRIAVPPPEEALLPDSQARALASAMADALQAQEVPALATDAPLPLDWRLAIVAEASGALVQPRFALFDADGRPQGAVQAPPVPARAWAEAAPQTLAAVANQGANRVAQMLLTIQAARAAATPQALASGPPRIRFIPVRRAPGDGNTALTNRMREFLGNRGYVAQDTADGAAFAVTADVAVVPGTPGNDRVEIQWIVSRRDGYELGRVVQLNEVPRGRLNGLWGDVAYVAAEQAAGGVETIIRNASEGQQGGGAAPSR